MQNTFEFRQTRTVYCFSIDHKEEVFIDFDGLHHDVDNIGADLYALYWVNVMLVTNDSQEGMSNELVNQCATVYALRYGQLPENVKVSAHCYIENQNNHQ